MEWVPLGPTVSSAGVGGISKISVSGGESTIGGFVRGRALWGVGVIKS